MKQRNLLITLLLTLVLWGTMGMSAWANLEIRLSADNPRQTFYLNRETNRYLITLKSKNTDICPISIKDGDSPVKGVSSDMTITGQRETYFLKSDEQLMYVLANCYSYVIETTITSGDFTVEIAPAEDCAKMTNLAMAQNAPELKRDGHTGWFTDFDVPNLERMNESYADYAWYKLGFDYGKSCYYVECQDNVDLVLLKQQSGSEGTFTEVGVKTKYGPDSYVEYKESSDDADVYLLVRQKDAQYVPAYDLVGTYKGEYKSMMGIRQKDSKTLKEGTNHVELYYEGGAMKSFMGCKWFKFVPAFTDTYTFKTLVDWNATAPTNDPVIYILNSNYEVVAHAYHNGIMGWLEGFVLDVQLESSKTYYVLMKDMFNSTVDTYLHISCASFYNELTSAAQQAPILNEGENSVDISNSEPFPQLENYTWYRFSPKSSEAYDFVIGGDETIEAIFMDGAMNEIARPTWESGPGKFRSSLVKGDNYFLLFRTIDGQSKSGVSVRIESETTREKAAIEAAIASAVPLYVGDNVVSLKSSDMMSDNKSQYTWFRYGTLDYHDIDTITIDPGSNIIGMEVWNGVQNMTLGDQQVLTPYPVQARGEVVDGKFVLVGRNVHEAYFILLRTKDGSALNNVTVHVSSCFKWNKEHAVDIKEGDNSVSINAANASLDGAPTLQCTWAKFVPEFTDKYIFVAPTNVKAEVVNASFETLTEYNLTKGETYYYLARSKDYAAIKNASIKVLSNAYYASLAAPIMEGENTITFRAVPPAETIALTSYLTLMYTWLKIVPEYTATYSFKQIDKTTSYLLDASFNKLSDTNLTKGETYYYLIKKMNSAISSSATLEVTCPQYNSFKYEEQMAEYAAAATMIQEGDNTVAINAVDASLSARPLLQYTWFKVVPAYTDDYMASWTPNCFYKQLDANLNECSSFQLEEGKTYYYLLKTADGSAAADASIKFYCKKWLAETAETIQEGTNIVDINKWNTSLSSTSLYTYTWFKFVPAYSSMYTFSAPNNTSIKLLDASFNAFSYYALTKGETYYCLVKATDGVGIADATITIDCESIELFERAANAPIVEDGENNIHLKGYGFNYQNSLLTYNWFKFVPKYQGYYSFSTETTVEFCLLKSDFSKCSYSRRNGTNKSKTVDQLIPEETYYVLLHTPTNMSDCDITLNIWNDAGVMSQLAEGATSVYEGMNTISLLPHSEVNNENGSGYTWFKFVPSKNDDYYISYPFDVTANIRVMDASFNAVYTKSTQIEEIGCTLKKDETYYILLNARTSYGSGAPELENLSLIIETNAIAIGKKFPYSSVNIGINNLDYTLQNKDKVDIDPLYQYVWYSFIPPFGEKYTFTASDDIEWLLYDSDDCEFKSDMNLEANHQCYVLVRSVKDHGDLPTLLIECPRSSVMQKMTLIGEPYGTCVGQEIELTACDCSRNDLIDDYCWFRLPTPSIFVGIPEIGVCNITFEEDDVEYLVCSYEDFSKDGGPFMESTNQVTLPGDGSVLAIRYKDGHAGKAHITIMPDGYEDAPILRDGQNTISLSDGHSGIFRFIPEETGRYELTGANNVPSGYCLLNNGSVYLTVSEVGKTYYMLITYNGEMYDSFNIELKPLSFKCVLPPIMSDEELMAIPDLPEEVIAAVTRYQAEGKAYKVYAVHSPNHLEGIRRILHEDPTGNVIIVQMRDIVYNNMTVRYGDDSGSTSYLDTTFEGEFHEWQSIQHAVSDKVPAVGDVHWAGCHHAIIGMNVLEDKNSGLFANANNVHFYDLGIEKFYSYAWSPSTGSYRGAFAGSLEDGSLDGCWVKTFLVHTGSDAVGGLVGKATNSAITNCMSPDEVCQTQWIMAQVTKGFFVGEYVASKPTMFANNLTPPGCSWTWYEFGICDELAYSNMIGGNNYSSHYDYGFNRWMTGFITDGGVWFEEVNTEDGTLAYRLQGDQKRHYWGQYLGKGGNTFPCLGGPVVALNSTTGKYYNPAAGDYNLDGQVDQNDEPVLTDIILGKAEDKTFFPSYYSAGTGRYPAMAQRPHVGNMFLLKSSCKGDNKVRELAVLGLGLDDEGTVHVATGSVIYGSVQAYPACADNTSVEWTSSNTSVAQVDAVNCQIQALGAGTATITVKAKGGSTASWSFTVVVE